MSNVLSLIVSCLLPISVLAQNPDANIEKRDTIVRLGGKKLAVDVLNVSATNVTYRFPGETENKTLERKQVERIRYKSGKVDIFNKPVLQMLNESQWEAVLVTEKKSDIDGLYEYCTIESTSSSDARSSKAAKKSATIRLQKKAANLGANIILVTKAQAKGGYGELPGYDMEAIAYGFVAPSEEVKKKLQEAEQDKKAKEGTQKK